MIKSLIIIFSCLTSINTWAQISHLEDIDKISLEEIEGDIQLNDAMIAQERDSISGITLKTFNTADDNGRFSFLYHLNSNLLDLTDISSFEFIFAKRYDWGWIEYSLVRTSALIEDITAYNTNIGATSEQLLEDAHTITEFGIGLGYRSKYIQHLINSNSIFETISASLEYVNFTDNTNNETFSGIGLKADFGVHVRSSKNFHYGLKLGTHLASVTKSQTYEFQPDTETALLLRWISLGADLTFYY